VVPLKMLISSSRPRLVVFRSTIFTEGARLQSVRKAAAVFSTRRAASPGARVPKPASETVPARRLSSS
jgi:hypothetical protein